MKMLYVAFCCLFTSIAAGGYALGYVMAHQEVARECERLGGFYVGPKTYSCQIKGGQHGAE